MGLFEQIGAALGGGGASGGLMGGGGAFSGQAFSNALRIGGQADPMRRNERVPDDDDEEEKRRKMMLMLQMGMPAEVNIGEQPLQQMPGGLMNYFGG